MRREFPVLALVIAACRACIPAEANDGADDDATSPCVDARSAAASDAVLVDIRGADAFVAGHPAGAIAFDASQLLRERDGLTNEVVDDATAAAALGAAGIRADRSVIVVGDATDTTAARLVWTLTLLGHADVGLLDGGIVAWRAAGLPEASGAATADPQTWALADREPVAVDAPWILAHLADPEVVLVDVRTAEEFDAGHIPGARSIDWLSTVEGGRLLAQDALEARYADVDRDATVVVYCQSGMRAAVGWVALRTLGYADVRLYDGSWAEWGARDDLPRESRE